MNSKKIYMNNKKIYLTAIVCIFVATFIICKKFDNRSYAAVDTDTIGVIEDGTVFKFDKKNMYTHYHIDNNFHSSASGTKILKNKNDSSQKVVVYCAEQGATLGSANNRKRYALNSDKVSIDDGVKNKLNIMLNYAYPYITLGTLKTMLKGSYGLGDAYAQYNFDDLNVQETITAVQAAIWNIMKSTDKFKYDKKIDGSDDSSLNNFSKCSDYYSGKILTSEEEAWYNESQCSKDGKFYKYVYSTNSNNVKNRINTLINWYTNTLVNNSPSLDVDNYSVDNSDENRPKFVDEAGGDTKEVDITIINSNNSSYDIVFKDIEGHELLTTNSNNGNTFHLSGLPADIKGINAVITSVSAKKNVYYYKGTGQDFIGVDNSKFTTTLTISNDGNAKIIVYKVEGNDKNVDVNYELTDVDNSLCGEGCIAGADFTLYSGNKEFIKNVFVTKNTPTVIENLPIGDYYLKEEQPPIGYDYYDYNVEPVDSEGYIKITITDNQGVASVIVNNDPTEIFIKKIGKDNPNEILSGAKFFIEDIDESLYEKFGTSDQEGPHHINNLPVGSYYLKEIETPINYYAEHTKYKFTVGKHSSLEDMDEDAILVKATNNIITIENIPGVVITKTDFAGDCFPGAKLVVRDSDSKIVDEWTSVCTEGHDNHLIQLNAGTYTLSEDLTPVGYATAETITFTVDANGRVDKKLQMKNVPINVCIHKVISGTDKYLEGAEFEIYREDGNLYEKFTSDNQKTCISRMPVGTYTIKEVKAPNGYKITSEITTIEVKDTDQDQNFTIENELEVPKTSVNASKAIILVSTVFAVVGVGLVTYYGYKRQN